MRADDQDEVSEGEPAEEAPAPQMTSRGVVGRNIAVLLGSQVVTWSLALVLTVFEPRFLGPDGIGQLRIAIAIWSIVNVFAELGTSTLLTLEFARDPRRATALLGPVIRLRAAAEIVAAVAILVFCLAAGYDAETGVTVAMIGIGLAIGLFAEIARFSLHGLQWMGATARADIASKAVLVVAVVATLVAGGGPPAVAAVMILPSALACWMLWRALRTQLEPVPRGARLSEMTVLRRSSPYLVGTAVAVVYAQIDIVVISLVATTDEVGWYAAAATLFGSLLFIPSMITTSLFPALAQMHEHRPEAVPSLLARSVRSILLVAVPMGVGTIVVADAVATLVLGDDFENSGPVLAAFGVVLIIMFQTILFGQFAFAIGRHRLYITAMVIATIATLPLDLILVPWTRARFDNGAIGGAIAYVITEGFLLVVAIWKLAPQLFERATVVRVVKCTIGAAALLAAAWPLRDSFVALPMIAGGLAYVVAVLVLRIPNQEEWEIGRRLLAKVRSKVGRGHQEPAVDGATG